MRAFAFLVVIPKGNLLLALAFLVVIPSAASEPAVSRSSPAPAQSGCPILTTGFIVVRVGIAHLARPLPPMPTRPNTSGKTITTRCASSLSLTDPPPNRASAVGMLSVTEAQIQPKIPVNPHSHPKPHQTRPNTSDSNSRIFAHFPTSNHYNRSKPLLANSSQAASKAYPAFRVTNLTPFLSRF